MRASIAATLVLCSFLAAGCGGDDDTDDSNRAAAYETPAGGTREIPISAAAAEDQGQLTAEAQSGDELTEEAYAQYEDSVEAMAYLLDAYWEDAFEEAALDSYESPSDIYGYYPGEDTDVRCGGEDAATPENAFFCGGTGEIAWDEPGLFLPTTSNVATWRSGSSWLTSGAISSRTARAPSSGSPMSRS